MSKVERSPGKFGRQCDAADDESCCMRSRELVDFSAAVSGRTETKFVPQKEEDCDNDDPRKIKEEQLTGNTVGVIENGKGEDIVVQTSTEVAKNRSADNQYDATSEMDMLDFDLDFLTTADAYTYIESSSAIFEHHCQTIRQEAKEQSLSLYEEKFKSEVTGAYLLPNVLSKQPSHQISPSLQSVYSSTDDMIDYLDLNNDFNSCSIPPQQDTSEKEKGQRRFRSNSLAFGDLACETPCSRESKNSLHSRWVDRHDIASPYHAQEEDNTDIPFCNSTLYSSDFVESVQSGSGAIFTETYWQIHPSSDFTMKNRIMSAEKKRRKKQEKKNKKDKKESGGRKKNERRSTVKKKKKSASRVQKEVKNHGKATANPTKASRKRGRDDQLSGNADRVSRTPELGRAHLMNATTLYDLRVEIGRLPDGWVGAYSPESRKIRIERFLEKRKQRNWKKEIRYNVRKNFADSRVRVKGRFIKRKCHEKTMV